MKQIALPNGVTVEIHEGLTVTRFADGLSIDGAPDGSAEQLRTCRELGYGDDVERMNRHHDIAHSLIAAWLGLPHSPTLRAAAEGTVWPMWPVEEDAVKAIQRLALCAGVDLEKLTDPFLRRLILTDDISKKASGAAAAPTTPTLAAAVVSAPVPMPRAKTVTVALINQSTVVTDAELDRCARALNIQVNRDFTPYWGTDCTVVAVHKGKTPPKGSWWLVVLDTSDVAGALGYHDLTPDFLPTGLVFAKTDQQYGLSWTVTASHELLEMIEDPWINVTGMSENQGGQVILFAYEVCDQVERDEDGYTIDLGDGSPPVLVSNFVTPAWFGCTSGYKGKFDFMGQLKAPFTLRPGGYISVWSASKGWYDLSAERTPDQPVTTNALQPLPGQRRYKRRFGPGTWLVTTADPAKAP